MWDEVSQTLHQSTVRVLSQFAGLLPGMLALVLALLLAILVAWVITFALRRFLHGVHFDEQLKRWGFSGVAGWAPQESPTLLLTRAIAWSIVLLGFVLGLAAFDATLTSSLALNLLAYVPRAIAAVLLMVFGTMIARYLARNVLIGAVNMNLHYARLLATGVKWMVMVLTIAMALDSLQIGTSIVHLAFGILFGGIVLALALAVGLGSKELVSRSLERETDRSPVMPVEEPFRHL